MFLNGKTLLIGIIILAVIGFGYIIFSDTSGKSGSTQISLTTDPDPVRLGKATFLITVKDSTGKPVDNAKVYFDLSMTMMNMGTQNGYATSQGNGIYAAAGSLSMQGPWQVSTKVSMPDGKETSKDFTVTVQ